MLPPIQDQDKNNATCPSLSQDAVMCPPPLSSGNCDVFPPPERCDAFPPPYCDASSSTSRYCKVFYQHSRCCAFLLRHRMVQCVLSTTQAAEQAIIVQKVDQHDHPLPDDDVHAVEEAAHPHPTQMMLCDQPHPQPQDDASRVLPCTQVAEQAATAQKVDRNPLPPPEIVHSGEETGHHHVLLHTHLDHIVRDDLPPFVTDEQEGPAVLKHFPPPSYLKEVFPSTAAPLPPLTWQAPPPPSLLSTKARPSHLQPGCCHHPGWLCVSPFPA